MASFTATAGSETEGGNLVRRADPERPPILDGAGPLLECYDVVFCDVWGVLHNGVIAHPAAGEALSRFRAGGGLVVLLSNAPVPWTSVARVLELRGVRRDAWDAVVSSGDLTRDHIVQRGYRRLHHIGPARDLSLFKGLKVARVGLAEAEAILCTGLNDDANETGETYRPLLEHAKALGLPFVCANPDLVVDVGGTLLPCAGLLASVYEDLGGQVFWAGKPYRVAYERAHARAEELIGRSVDPSRILAIGDAIRTDVAGAVAFGIDALFIAHGIHRAEIMRGGRLEEAALARLIATAPGKLKGAMTELAW
jgi:HAD superfamily hydrolase (TIGR01459 family)